MKQRGVILIQVLIIFAIVAAIAAGLAYQQQVQMGRMEAQTGWSQRQQWLQSGEDIAIARLEQTESRTLTAENSLLAEPLGPLELIFEDNQDPLGEMVIYYSDENSKLNLNWLIPGHPFQARAVVALDAIMAEAQITDSLLASNIVGWVDINSPTQTYYTGKEEPYRNSGVAFADISELKLVEGMDQEKFQKLAPFVTAIPASSKLNINGVSETIWRALIPEVDFGLIETIRTVDGVEVETILEGQEDEIREKFPTELLTSHTTYIRAVTVVGPNETISDEDRFGVIERIYARTSLLRWAEDEPIQVLRRRDGLDEPLEIGEETLYTGFAESF